ncbi:MAG: amidohydrolase [Oscillospiraceae bacterium]
MTKEIFEFANKIQNELIEMRREIHKNPELSFEEFETSQYICKKLDEIGVPYKANVARTGILATLQCGTQKKALLIRADIDALPLQEEAVSEYSSKNPGKMHACGHDAHTAILLGTCMLLNSFKEKINGTVKFLFEPGEETTGGAKPMIEEGVLKNPDVDACIALHVDPDINVGGIAVKAGPIYASPDDFEITIKGKGGHGAEPHLCIDPILVSAQIINNLQTITSRFMNPFLPAVVSICSIHSGTASNVIPNTAKILGTARALDLNVRELLKTSIETIVKGACEANNAEYEYIFTKLYPPLINDANIANMIFASAKKYLPNAVLGGSATMAGEDFAYFAQSVPSALFKLGCKNDNKKVVNQLHNSNFDIDEKCLKYGVMIFSDFALNFLK